MLVEVVTGQNLTNNLISSYKMNSEMNLADEMAW